MGAIDQYERQLGRKLLLNMLASLPFQTGQPLEVATDIPARFREFVQSLRSLGDTDFVVTTLLDAIGQIATETDLHLEIKCGGNPNSVRFECAGDEEFLGLTIESLNLLIQLIIHTFLLDLDCAPQMGELVKMFSTNAAATTCFGLAVREKKVPISMSLAKAIVIQLSKVMPPQMTQHYQCYNADFRDAYEQTAYTLSYCLDTVLAAVAVAQPAVLESAISSAMDHTFSLGTDEANMDEEGFPEIMRVQMFNRDKILAYLDRTIGLASEMHSVEQRQFLMHYVVKALLNGNLFVPLSEMVWTREMVEQIRNMLIRIKSFSHIDSPEACCDHIIATFLASMVPEPYSSELKPYWTPFWDLHIANLQVDTQSIPASLEYVSFVFRYDNVCAIFKGGNKSIQQYGLSIFNIIKHHMQEKTLVSGTSLCNVSPIQQISMNRFYLRLAPEKLLGNEGWLIQSLNPDNAHSFFAGFSERIELCDATVWSELELWQDEIVEILCRCCNLAADSQDESFNSAFVGGGSFVMLIPDFGNIVSESNKLKLTATMYMKLDKLSSTAVNKAIEMLTHIFSSHEATSCDSLHDVFNLLSDFVYSRAESLLKIDTPLRWELDYMRKLVSSRVEIARKLPHDQGVPKSYDPEKEAKLRCSILMGLCCSRQSSVVVAVDCLALLSEEILLLVDPNFSEDILANNFTDYDLLKFVTQNDLIKLSSPIQLLTTLQKRATTCTHASRTIQLLLENCEVYSDYIYAHYGSGKQPINVSVKKVMVNITLLRDAAWFHIVNAKSETNCATTYAYLLKRFDQLVHIDPAFKTILVSRSHSLLTVRSSTAIGISNYIFKNVLLPAISREYPSELERDSVIEAIACFLMSLPKLIELAITDPSPKFDFDLPAAVDSLLNFLEPCLADPRKYGNICRQAMQLVHSIARIENFFVHSKAKCLSPLLDKTLQLLGRCSAQPQVLELALLISKILPALFKDYKVDLTMLNAKSDVDTILAWYCGIIKSTLEPSKLFNHNLHSEVEIISNLRQALVKLFVANPELTLIVATTKNTLQYELLRTCVLDAFAEICVADHQNGEKDTDRYEELVKTMVAVPELTVALCEVCPGLEANELASTLLQCYSNKSHVLNLMKLAVQREIDSARSTNDLFRHNSVITRVVIQFTTKLMRPVLERCLSPIVARVAASPLSYLLERGSATGATGAYELVHAAISLLFEGAEGNIPDACLAFLAYVNSIVEKKFPENSFFGLRNLLILRVICPAIMSPYEHGLVQFPVGETQHKALLGLAKSIQRVDSENSTLAKLQEDLLFSLRAKPASLESFEYDDLYTSEEMKLAMLRLHRYVSHHAPELRAFCQTADSEQDSLYAIQSKNSSAAAAMSAAAAGPSSNRNSFDSNDRWSLSTSSNDYNSLYSIEGDLETSSASSAGRESLLVMFGDLLKKLGPPPVFIQTAVNCVDPSTMQMMGNESYRTLVEGNLSQNEPFCVNSVNLRGRACVSTYANRNSPNPIINKLFAHHLFQAIQRGLRDHSEPVIVFSDLSCPFIEIKSWARMNRKFSAELAPYSCEPITYCIPYAYAAEYQAFSPEAAVAKRIGRSVYHSVGDLTESELKDYGIGGSAFQILSDYEHAHKFTNVPLKIFHTNVIGDVWMGREFVIVKSNILLPMGKAITTCDVISRNSIVVNRNNVELHCRNKGYHSCITFNKDAVNGLYRKAWELFYRPQAAIFQELPALQISPDETVSRLLFLCLADLCSPNNQELRESAFKLLVSLPARFNLKVGPQFPPDQQLHLSIVQVVRVIKISRSFAEAHLKLTTSILRSFINIIPQQKNPRQQVVLVRVMEPWISNLTKCIELGKRTMQREIVGIIHGILGLLAHEGSLREVVTSHVWPNIINQRAIFPIVVAEWRDYAIEEVFKKRRGLENPYSVIFAFPIPVWGVRDLFDRLYFSCLDWDASYEVTTWTQHINWVPIEVVVLLLSNAILGSCREINELIADFNFVIIAFSSVGPLNFRKAVHHLVVNILDKLMISPDFDMSNYQCVRNLRDSITSTRGEVLFGTQEGVHDDAYDLYSQFSSTDVHDLVKLVIELNFAVVPTGEQANTRRKTSDLLLKFIDRTYPPLQHKCILGLQGLYDGDASDKTVTHLLDSMQRILAGCKSPVMVQSYINSFLTSLAAILPNLEDSSFYVPRLFWFSVSILGLRVRSLYESSLRLLEQCLRVIFVRSSNRLDVIERVLNSRKPTHLSQWWKASSELLVASLETPHLSVILGEMFVPGLQVSTSVNSTLAVCEQIVVADARKPAKLEDSASYASNHAGISSSLRSFNFSDSQSVRTSDGNETDSSFNISPSTSSTFTFLLFLYLSTQSIEDLAKLPLEIGVPLGVMDGDRVLEDIRHELYAHASYDSNSAIIGLVDACRITGFSPSMSFTFAGPRLLDFICGLQDQRLITLLFPLLRPTLNRLITIDDPVINNKLVGWTKILFARDASFAKARSANLQRVRNALSQEGRHSTVDEEFNLIQLESKHIVDLKAVNAIGSLCEVIRMV